MSISDVDTIEQLLAQIENLKKHILKLDTALDQEAWDSKRGKFVKLRELPWVAKVLDDERN